MKSAHNIEVSSLVVVGTMVLSAPVIGLSAEYVPAPVPMTRQTTCYDSGGTTIPCANTGQDGQYQAGNKWPKLRFKDNKNGTVTDLLTSLTWLKDANCGALGPSLWAEATAKVRALKNGACGLKDKSKKGSWRLPTIKELQSLVDYRSSATRTPALSDGAGNGPWQEGNAFTHVQSYYYWSSTTAVSWPDAAWVVNFNDGGTTAEQKIFNWHVWPVRKEGQIFTGEASCAKTGWKVLGFKNPKQCRQFIAAPRFQDNFDGTVTDRYTRLVWLKNAFCTESPFTMPYNRSDWNDALSSVAYLKSGMCGLSDGSVPGDWRLPNVQEMQSLIDYRNSGSFVLGGGGGPAVPDNGAAFTGIQKEYYWTSTTVSGIPDSAWLIDFNLGYVTHKQDETKSIKKEAATNQDLHVVWAVRGGPVFPNARAQCKKDGWKNYGFNSRIQCLQFVKLR